MRSHNDARSVLQHVTSRTPSRLHARFRFVAAACAPAAAIRAHSGVAEIKEMHRTSSLPVHNLLKSKKTRILLFLFSLPSHPSAVSYGPRAIVWHPDARQTAQTSSRWLFTTLQCPTTASSHRALPWPTAPQNRPAQAVDSSELGSFLYIVFIAFKGDVLNASRGE